MIKKMTIIQVMIPALWKTKRLTWLHHLLFNKRVTLKKSAFRSKRTPLSSEQAPTSMQSSVSGVQKHRNSGGSGDTVHEDIVATNSSRRLSFTAVRSPSNVANVSTTGNLVKVLMQFFFMPYNVLVKPMDTTCQKRMMKKY